MGAYTDILRHTPDHENLVTSTDSEVLCRVVGRWVGQGGKDSLDNTTNVDILEYISTNLLLKQSREGEAQGELVSVSD
jgi:hypothetical protein